MPNKEHEREICSLVTKLRFKRSNEIINRVWYPEDDVPTPEDPIDAVYVTNLGEYVLEHTTLESYSSQIAEDHKISKILENTYNLSRRISSEGRYEITFGTETLRDINIGARFLKSLSDWVAEKAMTLEEGKPGIEKRHMAEGTLTIKGRSIKVQLYRWPYSGVIVTIARANPEQQKKRLLVRTEASLSNKMPKLARWKQDRNAFSILIIESVDVALASIADLENAVLKTIQEFHEQPDSLYIVHTDRAECQIWECSQPFGQDTISYLDCHILKNPL